MAVSQQENYQLNRMQTAEALYGREPAPMVGILGKDHITELRYNKSQALVAEHEQHHLLVAHEYARIPYEHMSLTAVPDEADGTLGKVTLPGHIDFISLQVTAMASSIPTSAGRVDGTGSDVLKSWYIYNRMGGIHPEDAKSRAAAVLSGSEELRAEAAKIIVYMQNELGYPAIPGDMYPLIMARARWEIEQRNEIKKIEDVVKQKRPFDADQKVQDDHASDPNKSTVIKPLQDSKYGFLIVYKTGENVDRSYRVCGVCLQTNGHTDWCGTIRTQDKLVEQWNGRVLDVILSNPEAVIEDILQEGKRFAREHEHDQDPIS